MTKYDPSVWEDKKLEELYDKVGWTTNRVNTLDLIQKFEHDSMLDVGCLDGAYIRKLRKMGYDKMYHGIDIAHRHIKVAQERSPNELFEVGDARKLKFKAKSFDLVMLSDVIQHLPDPVKPIKEACRVAKRYVILSVYGTEKETYTNHGKRTMNTYYNKKDIESIVPSNYKIIEFVDLPFPTDDKPKDRKIYHFVLERK